MKPEGTHPGTEWCRRRIPRRVAIEGLRMRAVVTGWRPRAGKIRDDKEQVMVVGFSLEEHGGVPRQR